MHWTTAKLIVLDRVEDFLVSGQAQYTRVVFAHKARALRRELPAHIVAAYDEIKARHKEPVVGVFEGKCGGCQTALSAAALARLSKERELSQCDHCGRIVYLAGGHDLVARAHQPGLKTETTT
jgi:hypothetical protein